MPRFNSWKEEQAYYQAEGFAIAMAACRMCGHKHTVIVFPSSHKGDYVNLACDICTARLLEIKQILIPAS